MAFEFRSFATVKLVLNVVGELSTEKNSWLRHRAVSLRQHGFLLLLYSGLMTVLARSYQEFSFLIFHSCVNLELFVGALSFWNIIDFSRKCFGTAGFKHALIYLTSILPSTGTRVHTPSHVLQPKIANSLQLYPIIQAAKFHRSVRYYG